MSAAITGFRSLCSSVMRHSVSQQGMRMAQVARRSLTGVIKSDQNLQAAVEQLHKIPGLSATRRAQGVAWFAFNSCVYNASLKIENVSPSDIQLTLYYKEKELLTSCGVTSDLVMLGLLGTKKAVTEDLKIETNGFVAIEYFEDAWYPPGTTLYHFEIIPDQLFFGDGSKITTSGHSWTVFQAGDGRFFLSNSYVEKQSATIQELTVDEMSAHLKDLCYLSGLNTWTADANAIYQRWFGVGDLMSSYEGMSTSSSQPWKVGFYITHVAIDGATHLDTILTESTQLDYFPQTVQLDPSNFSHWPMIAKLDLSGEWAHLSTQTRC